MKKTFNYSGRRKIYKSEFRINLNTSNGHKTIDVTLSLDGNKYDSNARIFLDAFYRTERKRFDFGKVGNITYPNDLSVDELIYTANLMFRLIIVDTTVSIGRIIAHADNIKIDNNSNTIPLLPVSYINLGHQVWKIDFTDLQGPTLIINNKIMNTESIIINDPSFYMHVYPAVIREIFVHMVFIDGVDDLEDPSVTWHKNWLIFSKEILPNDNHPKSLVLEPEGNTEKDEALRWIDNIVSEFCNNKISSSVWEKYLNIF